jgi:hypothetical protein
MKRVLVTVLAAISEASSRRISSIAGMPLSRSGEAGFSGPARFDERSVRVKKYVYLPYAFSVLPAAVDAAIRMWTRRNWEYWLHGPLTLSTAGMIVGSVARKRLDTGLHVTAMASRPRRQI